MNTLIITLIVIYVLSTALAYRYTMLVYSKRGIWYGTTPEIIDLLLTITPVLNTLQAFCWLIEHPVRSGPGLDLSKFFNIKD